MGCRRSAGNADSCSDLVWIPEIESRSAVRVAEVLCRSASRRTEGREAERVETSSRKPLRQGRFRLESIQDPSTIEMFQVEHNSI